MKNTPVLFLITFLLVQYATAQLADSCKLSIGTNVGGLSDYGTELPFVDMMKNCRLWYSKDANNPNGSPWDTESADSMTFRTDGYPTHIPQTIQNRTYTQKVATVWGITDGWQAGQYVVLFDGKGTLDFWGGCSHLTKTSANRYTFDFDNPVGSILQLTIETSDVADPVRNIRIIKTEYENTYQTKPFNPVWLQKLLIFKSVRFMDWGQTNGWGQSDGYNWEGETLFDWNQRSKLEYYTWANNKGIPYEMMIKLMNDYHLDGWVCVPHRASNDYIQQMAQMFHNQLNPERKLTVEYSNELWNWMFGQTNWCYHYGCVLKDKPWPEGIVPYIQNCLDIWTSVYGSDNKRLVRAVGLQTAWLDVSQRIANNLRKGSFDAVAPAFYFGLSSEALEKELDTLGSNATVADVVSRVRKSRANEKKWMLDIKTQLADPLAVPMCFYEGGQHITPTPFGEEPTYAQALVDIQRDTSMYNLYIEWFDFLRTLQQGNKSLQCMSFSFVGQRSARYGSWGILETMNQDTALVAAPKYKAIIENMHSGCYTITRINVAEPTDNMSVYPNPTCEYVVVKNKNIELIEYVTLTDLAGKILFEQKYADTQVQIDLSHYTQSVYLLYIRTTTNKTSTYKVVKK